MERLAALKPVVLLRDYSIMQSAWQANLQDSMSFKMLTWLLSLNSFTA